MTEEPVRADGYVSRRSSALTLGNCMKKRRSILLLIAWNLLSLFQVQAGTVVPSGDSGSAVLAINALGLELLAKGTVANANALLSPYSIQTALAMTFAGASGHTRTEMAKVLHYPADEADLHHSFAALRQALEQVARSTAERAKLARQYGGPTDPVTLTVANRLFGQSSYEFRR